ncbi:MAG: TIM barrel protein [Bacteroidota bacterium]
MSYLSPGSSKPLFEISLAEFSLAESLYNGKLDNLDFPAKAVNDFGIHAVEYVSGFWNGKCRDQAYLKELKKRTDDLDIKNVLIMVDSEGELGASNPAERYKAVENHYKWIEAAKFLECIAIRVNVDGDGTPEEIMKAAADGYGKLVEYGAKEGIYVIIENHMTISTNPDWLTGLLEQVNNPYAGCLPDFGNFTQREMPKEMTADSFKHSTIVAEYDQYEGVKKLMPYAKGISAKTISFDAAGNCLDTDFDRMLSIVKNGIGPNFKGYIGIEYAGHFMKMIGESGNYLDEDAGIRATKKLLERALA